MKTIEERAMWYQRGYLNTSPQYKPTLYNAYIEGATEQREIDIQRACEIHCKLCDNYNPMCVDGVMYMCDYCDKCKDILQIKQAMKGEE